MRLPAFFALLVLTACGGSAAQRPSPESPIPTSTSTSTPTLTSTTGASTPTDEGQTEHLPAKCSDPSASLCTVPNDFVDRLCAKPHQDVALALFAKTTAFTRLYLRGKLDELVFDEEVLALRFHAPPKNGMIVGSANGSYDALRWDGTCSLGLEAEMVTRTRPPRPKAARVKWHRMATGMQDALVAASDAVKQARARRGKECKGAMTGDVSAACERADQALSDSIVEYVRTNGSLPEPPVP